VGFEVQELELRVLGLEFRVWGLRFRSQSYGFWG
jgi:hypothetical protein